ncbi:right-handed parallel beta-helix repeat-containing protein [Methanobrevibacter millerae]|uniref:right-handed parallel beta-helix repeat-containing protein n=1 Tax=Methanobrevibacter millerae TaxID=230361 RepID=UPI0026F15FEE|nr:right-handed parallel beta-helix repeat-containing protein [Methanobrevibacter millerae]
MVSSVSANEYNSNNDFANVTTYSITSDLSNGEIQTMFNGASNGDTFEFTSKSYDNISLVVDKQLKIISNKNSIINVATSLTDKAKDMGLSNTFGFYFTQNSSGSILSGLNIIAANADYAVILDKSSNTIVENNEISQALNNVLVKNADNVQISENYIHNATNNSLQIKDINNISIFNNTIAFNGRSGIETSNMFDSLITWNEVYFNAFNGISMYNKSSNNKVMYNHVYENTNGIFLNAESYGDKFLYNTLEYNRMDPNSELGGFETGNGFLFGEEFETSKKQLPDISYNALMHNENFQAKNNPTKEQFKLGPNYFDSNDGEHTFICPMLLAKILKMDFTSVSNGIGIQIYDDGKPVNDFAFFDQKISVDGKEYSVEIQNGKGFIQTDSSQDHEVEIQHGEKVPDYRKETVEKYTPSSDDNKGSSSGSSGNEKGFGSTSGSSSGSGSGSGSSDTTTDSNDGNKGTSSNSNGNSNTNSTSNSVVSNNQGQVIANYGTNSSDIISESTSQTGEEEQSQGQENAAEAGSVDSGESSSPGDSDAEGKVYELDSVSKKSNPLQDNSIIIVLAIVFLVAIFIYGYRRKNEFE